MKIAITATAPNIDADVDPRFGRCQYFVIVDPQTMKHETMENAGAAAGGGAGIATAQGLSGKNIEAVITGHCGPNACGALNAAGIKIFTNASGKIKDAIEAYKAGKLTATSQPDVASHFGSGGGGHGQGRGMNSG